MSVLEITQRLQYRFAVSLATRTVGNSPSAAGAVTRALPPSAQTVQRMVAARRPALQTLVPCTVSAANTLYSLIHPALTMGRLLRWSDTITVSQGRPGNVF